MPIVKVIEVTGSSEKNIDNGVINCIEEVSKTIHNIDSIHIKDFKIFVKNRKPLSYDIICNVSYRMEDVNMYGNFQKIN